MAQYAWFDHTVASPSPVLGFYDTVALYYPNLPAAADLFPLTADQWANRLNGLWGVQGGVTGTLVSIAAIPVPDPVALSQAALAQRIAAGIGITSDSTPGVNATYALDAVSTAQIFQIGLYASQFGAFPSGTSTQDYPDSSGTFHAFSVPLFVAFLKAVAALTSALNMQQALMAQGGTPAWPPQTAGLP